MSSVTWIDAGHPDEWYKDRFMVTFTGEGIANPKYKDWVGGRMEVYVVGEQYAIDEIRFFAPWSPEWENFREQYDGHWLEKAKFDEVVETVKTQFYQLINNH